MGNLITIINWLLPLAYLALMIDYGATFFLRTKNEARNPWLVAVITVHAVSLILRTIHIGHPPLEGTYEILSILAMATAGVYCLIEWTTHDRRSGVFIFVLVFLFQYTSTVFLAAAAPGAAGLNSQTNWSRLHTLPAIITYTAFSISAVYGILHRIDQRSLKQHRIGLLFDRLPPFELLGKMTWAAMVVGFIFMTITICTSPFLVDHTPGGTISPKVLAKIIIGTSAWLVYLAAILGRLIRKWSAPRISIFSVTGFILIAIMLITSAVLR